MQDLRLMLLLFGVITIIVLFLHGVWARRKERSALFYDQTTKDQNQKEDDVLLQILDEEGVGEVKILKKAPPNVEKNAFDKAHDKKIPSQTKYQALKFDSSVACVTASSFSQISETEPQLQKKVMIYPIDLKKPIIHLFKKNKRYWFYMLLLIHRAPFLEKRF